mgnify:CR=1 FL=1
MNWANQTKIDKNDFFNRKVSKIDKSRVKYERKNYFRTKPGR